MMQLQSVRFVQPRSMRALNFPDPNIDVGKVFRKTIAGHHEFERRTVALRPELRRLLIMVDGHHSAQAFGRLFRPLELSHLLAELQSMGLIEATDAKPAFHEVMPSDMVGRLLGLSVFQLKAARRVAIDAANELLGAAAKPYCLALSICTDAHRLGAIMDELAKRIATAVGQDGVTVLYASVRDAVEHS